MSRDYYKPDRLFEQIIAPVQKSVPEDTIPIRHANLIRLETSGKFNSQITILSQAVKITKGHKLRTD